ncbi:7-cyano-7-deazaguanine synthase [Bienertia sinuspersici]
MGQNDRDCEDYIDETAPIKKLGSWVRASPWKGRLVEEKKETKGCSRRLFVAKPDSKIGGNKEEAVGVDGVTEKLSRVEINNEQEFQNKSQQLEKVNISKGGEGSTLQEGECVDISTSLSTLSKIWKRVPRKEANKENGEGDVEVGNFDGGMEVYKHIWFSRGGQKIQTGVLLRFLKSESEKPWLIGGDFNLMMESTEKNGGGVFNVNEADILRSAVQACDLVDMGFVGYEFTWSNNRGGEGNIQERLDRFLANGLWKAMYPGSFVTYLTKRRSDHLPLLMLVAGPMNYRKDKKK